MPPVPSPSPPLPEPLVRFGGGNKFVYSDEELDWLKQKVNEEDAESSESEDNVIRRNGIWRNYYIALTLVGTSYVVNEILKVNGHSIKHFMYYITLSVKNGENKYFQVKVVDRLHLYNSLDFPIVRPSRCEVSTFVLARAQALALH
ncbi:hypothetical protein H5410_020772 [Solanum commersonii]|uniref:Uncharacterized protein n=1 Tax=Solanum commersonii TaxID=4109 RepID=A0A9J5Z903_SOLCO|nr:hypothetical protein H5410_020772 [Solanum commersonii]